MHTANSSINGKLHVKKHKQEGLHHTTFPLFQKWPGIKCKDASDSDRHPHTSPFSDQVGTRNCQLSSFQKDPATPRVRISKDDKCLGSTVATREAYGMGGQENKGNWIATSTHKKHQKANHGKPFDNLRKRRPPKKKAAKAKLHACGKSSP